VEDIEIKICSVCNKPKKKSEYRSRGGNQKHLLKSRCNTCLYKEHRKWVDDNPEKVKEYRHKDSWTLAKRCSRRGITPEELIDLYKRQEECCAICNKYIEISESAIDHNHKTEEFRGVLCKKCNRGLGLFEDSPTILKNALDYLITTGYYGTS
jgi:hypothetical protein